MVSCFVTRNNQEPFVVESEAFRDFGLEQKADFVSKSGIYLPVNYNDAEIHLRSVAIPCNYFCNGFIGMDYLASKRHMAEILQKTYRPDILQHYLPETYTKWTSLPPPCPGDKWVLKKEVQGQTGIKLVHGDPRQHIETDTAVVQRFVDKPLLYNGHKVNLRIYVGCIMRAQETMFFYSKEGLVYYSQRPYTTGDWITTGYSQDRDVYKDNPTLVYDLLHKLSSTLRNAIRHNIHKALLLLMHPYKQLFVSRTQCAFQMFGVDLHIGADGKVMIMEANKSPDLNIKSDIDGMLKRLVVRKLYEAVLTGCLDSAVFQKLF